MKLKDLSKDELVNLLTLLCEKNKNQYIFRDDICSFLRLRWCNANDKLLNESEKCDILTIDGFNKWREIHKRIDKLQSHEIVDYYCTLDELE